jgi:hypothetical protein
MYLDKPVFAHYVFKWWYLFLKLLIHYMFRHHFNSAIIRCIK